MNGPKALNCFFPYFPLLMIVICSNKCFRGHWGINLPFMNSFPPTTFCDFNIVTGGLFCWLSWVTLILSGSILAGVRKFCSWKFWEGKCTVSLFVFRFLCSWMSPCIIVRRHLPLGQWFLVRIRQVDLEQESAGDSGCLCVSSTSCPKISWTFKYPQHYLPIVILY